MRRRLTAREALQLGSRLLQGVDVLHASFRAHFDIKPANVLSFYMPPGELLFTDHWKLADVGFVAHGDSVNQRRGTPGYHQVTVPANDPQQDLYAVGKTIYVLHTLASPSNDDEFLAFLDAPAMSGIGQDQLRHVIRRLCSNNERSRYRSAGEAVEGIEAALTKRTDDGVTKTHDRDHRTSTPATTRTQRGHQHKVVIGLFSLVMAIPLILSRLTGVEVTPTRKPIENPIVATQDYTPFTPRAKEYPALEYLGVNEQSFHEYKLTKDPSVTLVFVPGSVFYAGAQNTNPVGTNYDRFATYADEGPVHPRRVDSFFLSKYEITNAQYGRFCVETGTKPPRDPKFADLPNYFKDYPSHPVVNVTRQDARKYCSWAGLRLPDECEWEYAARGSEASRYPWGIDLPNTEDSFRANYSGYMNYDAWRNEKEGGSPTWRLDLFLHTAPVGSFPNGVGPFGTHDMAGNVWEWCSNTYESGSKCAVYRGGGFGSTAMILRSCYRNSNYPATRESWIGFRPARDGAP